MTDDRMPWDEDPEPTPELRIDGAGPVPDPVDPDPEDWPNRTHPSPPQPSTPVPESGSFLPPGVEIDPHIREATADEIASLIKDPDGAPYPSALVEAEVVDAMLDALADATERDRVAGHSTDAIKLAVRTRADVRRTARIERLAGDAPSSEGDVRREAVGAANDADVLFALAGAFTAGAKEATQIAGELLDELPGRGGKPRASLKVADGEGFQLAVTRSKRTETSVKLDEVVDVIVAREAAFAAAATGADPETGPTALKIHPAKVYATGLRAGIDAILELLSSPSFKVTALDALVKSLEDADDDDLAKRLRKAYGRVDKGEPSINLERKPLPETCVECGRAKGEHRVSCSLRVAKVNE